jgi:hypothetical protein
VSVIRMLWRRGPQANTRPAGRMICAETG